MAVTNFTSWKLKFESQSREQVVKQFNAVKEAANIYFEKLKQYTPVGMPSTWKRPAAYDYVPGALRQGYTKVVQEMAKVLQISIYTDRVYFIRIENGWSKQAPTGMRKRADLEWPSIIKSVGI